jgi:hypothetical protein
MKKSQLRKVILEAMKGYSKYAQGGVTQGGTTDDFRNILTAIAKGRPEEDSEEAKAERGNKILDKANPDNVARITRGEKPIYEQENQQTYLVSFRVGEDGDDDVEVKASSPEQAIEKVKSGEVKLAYGQSLPRLARGFSAKLKK